MMESRLAGGLRQFILIERLTVVRSEEHTSELQSHSDLVCRLLLEKKKKKRKRLGSLQVIRRLIPANLLELGDAEQCLRSAISLVWSDTAFADISRAPLRLMDLYHR